MKSYKEYYYNTINEDNIFNLVEDVFILWDNYVSKDRKNITYKIHGNNLQFTILPNMINLDPFKDKLVKLTKRWKKNIYWKDSTTFIIK